MRWMARYDGARQLHGEVMPLILSFTVLGHARPQGSTKTITRPVLDKVTRQPVRDEAGHMVMRSVITHSNRESLMLWRHSIRAAVQLHAPQLQGALRRDVIACVAVFHRTRPPSVSKRRLFPKTSPDLDKLLRAVGDALESTVVINDCLIKGWIAWEVYTEGASRLELQIWEPDSPRLPAPESNPFHQPGLFQ